MGEPFPEWLEPMAARLTQERFTGPDWLFERKLDGIRLLAFKEGDRVRLLSRNRLAQAYPAVACAVAALPAHDLVLDGEATWDPGSRVAYHVFDILWKDGRNVTSLPLEERRALLAGLPLDPPLGRVEELADPRPWERACAEGWEGVIAKRRGSPYEHRRSPHWLKMKCEKTQLLVVGGFTDPQGGRVGLGALLVGYREGEDLVFAGKVGTGFDTATLRDLRQRLDALEVPDPPFTRARGLPRRRAHWVHPEIVVEAAFTEWTGHDKLRHPRLLGFRPEKSPRDAVRPAAASSRSVGLEAGGTGRPAITHPDKVLFPDDGITKGELADYYERIAPVMVPHLSGRPVTMERFPSGIGNRGFMQKDVSKGFPPWLERAATPKKDGTVHYPIVRDTRALLWMANLNCITPHVWPSRLPRLSFPDLCLFDLDPSEEDAAALRAAALAVRDLLLELGLRSWVKTSGSKGFHICVPLDGEADFHEVASFTHRVGGLLVERDPARLTREFAKKDRGGRIYVDTGRNGFGATFAAAYAVRPRPGAPVSAPCTWQEVETGAASPRTFTLRTMAERLAEVGDLWAEVREGGQPLPPARERLEALRAS